MTISQGTLSLLGVRNELNLGNNLRAYLRGGKTSSYIVGSPNSGTITLRQLRGGWASTVYYNYNFTVDSLGLSGFIPNIAATPSQSGVSFSSGLSNNGDPDNAYVLNQGAVTGNRGYPTTGAYYFVQGVDNNGGGIGIRFNNANVGLAWQSTVDDSNAASWVDAIGLNYHTSSNSGTFTAQTVNYVGNGGLFFASFGVGFFDVFNGNNFFAVYAKGGSIYYGMVNRSQLRSGVIAPISEFNFGEYSWRSSCMTILHGYIESLGAGTFNSVALACDEVLFRGHAFPSDHRMFARGSTVTRNIYRNAARRGDIDGRVFE